MRASLLLLLALAPACAPKHPGDVVGTGWQAGVAFEFEGPRAAGSKPPPRRAVRNAMAQPAHPLFQAAPPLDRETLDKDAWRIEIFYANHGYFDARFLGWELRPHADGRTYRIIGHLSVGEPSLLRDVRVDGVEKLGRPLRVRIDELFGGRGATVAPGNVFSADDYHDAIDGLRALLAESSYAYATVDGHVSVDPEAHTVDVTVAVSPGPASRFGAVTIAGLQKAPEAIVREKVGIEPGDAYSASALEKARAQLYALGVFGVVNVVPDLSDPTSPVVPLTVTVTEAKARELRAGPIIELEPGKATASFQAVWRDSNVASRLWRMEQDARVGVGVLVDRVQDLPDKTFSDIKPVVDVKGTVELPHLLGPTLSIVGTGRFQVGLEPGYRSISPSFSPTLVYSGVDDVRLSAGYSIKYNHFFDLTIPIEDIEDSEFGLDLRESYLLSMLEQRATWDGRNDPFSPRRGAYANLALAEAGGPLGGDYQFLRAVGEVRAYRNLVRLFGWDPDVVFAARLAGGIIAPYGSGPEASVPYAERLYLGGSTTVRGWGANRLGPYLCKAPDPTEAVPEPETPESCLSDIDLQVPVGGDVDLYGNFEVRKGLPLDLTAAVFVDVGQAWDTMADVDLSGLQVSVGGGLRYATPVGPIRLDVGFPLGQPFQYADHPRWALHLALAEAF